MNNKLTTIFFALVISCYIIHTAFAQQKEQSSCPDGGYPCRSECSMARGSIIRATDWVNAWQIAKETCTNANGLAIQLVDRSGPSFQTMKVFECVDLKASGELLIITVKKADKQEESVMIIRASDILRIEVTKRASVQD